MNYRDGGEWLDGPGLVAWLEPHLPTARKQRQGSAWPEALQRRLSDWRLGQPVNVYSLDSYLIELGLHPNELPDYLWIDHAATRYRKLDEYAVRDIRSRLADGSSIASLAREYFVTPDTIRQVRDRKTWRWVAA